MYIIPSLIEKWNNFFSLKHECIITVEHFHKFPSTYKDKGILKRKTLLSRK